MRVILLFMVIAALLSSEIITIKGEYCAPETQIKSITVDGVLKSNIKWESLGGRAFQLNFPGDKQKKYVVWLNTDKGIVSGECQDKRECILTPWRDILNKYAELFGNKEKKSDISKKLNNILGINGDPYLSNNKKKCDEKFLVLSGDINDPKSILAKLISDISDGYLDDESLHYFFPQATKRKFVSRPISITVSAYKLAKKWGAKLMHLGTGQTFHNRDGISSGAPSEMILYSDDGTGGINILYHTFDRGQLSGKIGPYTQVAYDLFTSNPKLLMLPSKIQGSIVDTLINQEAFQKAAKLYEQLIEGISTDSALYRRLLIDLSKQANDLLKDEQNDIIANLLITRLLDARAETISRSCRTKVDAKESVIDMSKGHCQHTVFKLFDGMLVDATAIENKPDKNVITVDFYTDSSLWYAVTDKEHYNKQGFINNLLDPNLIEPLNEGTVGKMTSRKKRTSMPIANFDENLKKPNSSGEYIIYRNKTGAIWDAPFILNVLSLVDVIADLSSNIKFAKNVSEKLKTMNINIKNKFEKNPTLKYALVILKTLYELTDSIFLLKGEDILTIDQRYGQIKLLVEKLSHILKPDPINDDIINFNKIGNINAYYNRFLQTAKIKILHIRKKGETESAKIVPNSNYWKGITTFIFWKKIYSGILSIFPDKEELKKELGTNKEPEDFLNEVALIKAKKAANPNLNLTSDEQNKIKVEKSFVEKHIKNMNKDVIIHLVTWERAIDVGIKIKEAEMSMFNIARSFNKYTITDVVYNLVELSLKNLEAKVKKVLLDELTYNIVMATTPASWYRILRGSNKGSAMLYDMFSKPTAYAFQIKRKNVKKMIFKEIVPPAFSPISYIDTKNYGVDKIIDFDSPSAFLTRNMRFQMSLGSNSISSLLAFPGVKFSYETDALIQKENLAQSYFEHHENDYVVFADWHVYKHNNYRELKVPLRVRTRRTSFKNNYFFFKSIGENFDCINDWSCIDEDERYHIRNGNPLLDDYLKKKRKSAISFFGFTRLFKDAGHQGDVTHRTIGVYTDSVHLWIGNKNNKKAPVQYASNLRVYIAKDYLQHKLNRVTENRLKLTAIYGTNTKGTCGSKNYSVNLKLQDLVLNMDLYRPIDIHNYHFYIRDVKNGRYFGPIKIIPPLEGHWNHNIYLSLAEVPGFINYINKRGASLEDKLSRLKIILIDDIVYNYCENISKNTDAILKALMDKYWGSKGGKKNPLLSIWLPHNGTKIKIIADSDGDGIPDDWERVHHLNPKNCIDGMKDYDDDNLSNLKEYLFNTDINNPDSDEDGIKDGLEVDYKLNPLDPKDANIDSDGDGFNNIDEIDSRTNPNDANSYPNSNLQNDRLKWKAFVTSLHGYRENDENPSDVIKDGYMRIEPFLSDTGYYWTNFHLAIPKVLDGDNIKFEARVKCSDEDGGISAYDTSLRVIGSTDNDTNKSAWATLMEGSWAQVYDSFGAGDTSISNIPELVRNLQNWHTIAIQTRNKKVSVYYDNQLLRETTYSGSVGKVIQLEISFKGSGTIDWVKLYQNNKLVMVDNFDRDGDATVKLSSNEDSCNYNTNDDSCIQTYSYSKDNYKTLNYSKNLDKTNINEDNKYIEDLTN